MPRYPFTPELLDTLPEELAELFRSLELQLLREICSRLKLSGQLNKVTVQAIQALRSHGVDLQDIEKAVADTCGIGLEMLDRLLDDVVEQNQKYYAEQIDLTQVTEPVRLVDDRDIEAIRRQTWSAYRNITGSMGFLVVQRGRLTLLPPARAYQWALDQAEVQLQSGAFSYNQAIFEAVRQLADSGLKTVSYESGHVDSVDVAVRRAVMTGVNQLNQKYREQSMDYLETDLLEVTAHRGARDIDGPLGWENHKAWQGKVYRWKAKPQASKGEYPDFEDTCGYGSVTGIGGANCRHSYWPFIEGVSDRTYTDEQLENIDPPPFEFEGHTYTAYQATQKQREIERTMRKLKRRRAALEAAGLEEDAQVAGIRLKRLTEKYRQFSEAAGLPEQWERTRMGFVDEASKTNAAERLEKFAQSGILSDTVSIERSSEVPGVHKVCDLDIKKFRCVTPNIRTNEVIITEERIEHIRQRHPDDFERYSGYLKEIIEKPDYIIEDPRPGTAMVLKEIQEQNEHFRLALRLITPTDNPEYKNSIITFMKIREKEWARILRNKKILYKSE